ncbi:MAG TPA: tetratricopeptide repeat protein, partial [Vicinamibacterales bacterium]|nr:tetratricopeptide repeat protein [Vicinamibacterales bacterium]
PLSAQAHNILGIVENSRDEPAAGLRHSLEELEIFQKIGDRRGLSQSLNNVGNSYRRLGDYAKALEYHQQSLAIKLELGDRDGAGYSHHNIGEALEDQGLHKQALQSYTRAEAEWRAVGNRRALAAAIKSQGVALEALGLLEQSLRRLQASLDMRRDPPNPHGEAETLLSLGRVQLRLGRYGQAVTSYSRALDLAEKLDQTTLIADALAGLATAEAASGNVLAASGLLEKQIALLQRMRDQERSRVRSEMQATLDAHESERRAEQLEQEAVLREETLRRGTAERNMAIIAAALLLVTALIAAYGFSMKRQSEQRLRRQAGALELALAQVKTLRGMLPLCAWCHRKARDDQGRWTDFETFVQEHTDAVVTHTICPDCQETNFPKPPGGAVTPPTG